MRGTIIEFTCDRCARSTKRAADRNVAEEAMPTRWRDLTLKGTEEQPHQHYELCAACADAFSAFMRNSRVMPGGDMAPIDAEVGVSDIPF